MKKSIYLVIIILIATSFNLKAQVIQSETELNKILCKNWKPDFAVMGDVKINQLPNTIAFELEFNSDNSYFVIKDNDKQKGKWTFNPDKKHIELSINNKVTSRIIKINETEFILVLVSEGIKNPSIPHMQIHFKS